MPRASQCCFLAASRAATASCRSRPSNSTAGRSRSCTGVTMAALLALASWRRARPTLPIAVAGRPKAAKATSLRSALVGGDVLGGVGVVAEANHLAGIVERPKVHLLIAVVA